MHNHKKLIPIFIILSILCGWTCGRRSEPANEAERFDRIARKLFKSEVYPGLARQITEDYGVTRGLCVDVGCGPAYLVIELAKLTDLSIIGVDIDSDAVAIGQRNVRMAGMQGRVAVEWGDVHRLRFRDGEADLIVSRGSFLFWKDRVLAFQEIHRVLKPGGVAFVGGGMGRFLTTEKKQEIRKELDRMNVKRPAVTRFEVEEALALAGVTQYRIFGDGSEDTGCKCGMWVEMRKSNSNGKQKLHGVK
ncbi:MAG TPA: class I SAM-dependent methyltransferase [bacterium]